MKLYAKSLAKYPNSGSPFIYPEYGLGGLSEAFARICSINGGDFLMERTINKFFYDSKTNHVVAVQSIHPETKEVEGCTVDAVVGDPSYFDDTRRVQSGSVIRCICLLRGPVPGLPKDLESAQIIYPQGQCIPKRKHDIYISVVGHRLKCTPENVWSATMSTMQESSESSGSSGSSGSSESSGSGESSSSSSKEEESSGIMAEFANVFSLLGGDINIIDTFYEATPYYTPSEINVLTSSQDDCVYVSKSVDATTHFESTTADIIELYKKVTGEDLDLSLPSPTNSQEEEEEKKGELKEE